MPCYQWKATDQSGRVSIETVEAPSVAQAREQLLADGYRDLVLQTDEFMEVARQGSLEATEPEFQEAALREMEAVMPTQRPPGFLKRWAREVREAPRWNLFLACLVTWGVFLGKWWIYGPGLLGLLVFPAMDLWFGLPVRIYDRLNRAKVWHRWEEALRLCDRLERIQRMVKIRVAEWEIPRCRAQALAGMGRLDEARRLFASCAHMPGLPRWMYLSLLAGIHDGARDFKESLRLREEAANEMPTNMTVWLDLALQHVHQFGDVAKARAALARVDPGLVPEAIRYSLLMVEGLLDCREGRMGEARQKLEDAQAVIRPNLHMSIFWGTYLLTRSYLCLALAGLGELKLATRIHREVREFLGRTGEVELWLWIDTELEGKPGFGRRPRLTNCPNGGGR